ncbi:hypothetical protein QQS21_004928 [Conoideocrella luteorostrata]|uniref:Uncharacterized protein n=1 Tax=Conoideocrella luteorostrata TaxID=1105319 RepID=A0AAJ0FU95_9HYPO|nr:hypothetical protein QQS21_004928 [Conoideocrella luteorostrata]
MSVTNMRDQNSLIAWCQEHGIPDEAVNELQAIVSSRGTDRAAFCLDICFSYELDQGGSFRHDSSRHATYYVQRREQRVQGNRSTLHNFQQLASPPSLNDFIRSITHIDLVRQSVFTRWQSAGYSANIPNLDRRQGTPFPGQLQHYLYGPYLEVSCQRFECAPADEAYTLLWAKTETGWESTRTPTCCIVEEPEMEVAVMRYIIECMPRSWAEKAPGWLGQLLELVEPEVDLLVGLSMQLWTANNLHMKGWIWRSSHREAAAPSVIQYQMNSILERCIVDLEARFLVLLQAVLQRDFFGYDWSAFVAAVIYLAALERDSWSLTYWLRPQSNVR